MGGKITREKLEELMFGVAYNIDGSVDKETEKVRNYTIEVKDGKTYVEVYNRPVEVLVGGEWKKVEDVVDEEGRTLLDELFTETHLQGRIILDTNDPSGISVRGRDRVRRLGKKLDEHNIRYPREFVWVDGAKDISGVIELPYDDYSTVFIATDPKENEEGELEPELIEVKTKEETGGERPYYEKKDGKTYIYVNHFSGGGGTQADPYIVANEDDLWNVRNNLSAYYVQTADIILTKWQEGEGWLPIGDNSDSSQRFNGYYDGQGFEIRDLYINRNQHYVGLFGWVSGGQIRRVKLVNVNVRNGNGSDYTGALAGRLDGGNVYDCAVVSGYVESRNGDSATAEYTGGLVGYKYSGSQVWRCYSHAHVASEGNYCGGLIGRSDGGEVYHSYSTGKVEDLTIAKNANYHGGLIGFGDCEDSCAWNIETSGLTYSAGNAHPGRTAEMRSESFWRNLTTSRPWDFIVDYYLGDQSLNFGYPENRKFIRYRYGDGTPENPFLIYTEFELNQMRHFLDKHFKLMDDIEITMSPNNMHGGFPPIGIGGEGTSVGWYPNVFCGSLDGNGKAIMNLTIHRQNWNFVGFFRALRNAEIKNLEFIDPNIRANQRSGVVFGRCWENTTFKNVKVSQFNGSDLRMGYQSGVFGGIVESVPSVLFEDCHTNADAYFTGDECAGFVGSVGYARNTFFRRCSTKGRLSSTSRYISGFVGRIQSNSTASDPRLHFEDCYTNVVIDSSGSRCAGFVGYVYHSGHNDAYNRYFSWKRCLSFSQNVDKSHTYYGFIGYSVRSTFYYVEEVYFDRQRADGTATVGSTSLFVPKYTAELQHPSTYSDPSWDFDNVWSLSEEHNEGYPELRSGYPDPVPILGFRNAYGKYYTDDKGNILRYLEFGTMVAGTTTVPRPVWIQNNANFPVKEMTVWVDEDSVKEGITVEISQSNNPFVPEQKIVFGGTVPIGEARKFYVRFSSEVTVKEGGTFDLRAKASPSS